MKKLKRLLRILYLITVYLIAGYTLRETSILIRMVINRNFLKDYEH
ncbi:MAG: hypothetical protein V1709_00925 [Planctomycetota bacterium]